jgi:hypothetical protein
MLDGWRDSAGAVREHDYAFLQGHPIHYDMEALCSAIYNHKESSCEKP